MILPALATPIGLAPSVAPRVPGGELAGGDFGGTLAALLGGALPPVEAAAAPVADAIGRQPAGESGKLLPDAAAPTDATAPWSPGVTATPLPAGVVPPPVSAVALPAMTAPVVPGVAMPFTQPQPARAVPLAADAIVVEPHAAPDVAVSDPLNPAPASALPSSTAPLPMLQLTPAPVSAAALATSALTPLKPSVVAALVGTPPEAATPVRVEPDPAMNRPPVVPDRAVRIAVRTSDRPAAARPSTNRPTDTDVNGDDSPEPVLVTADPRPVPLAPPMAIAEPIAAVTVPAAQPPEPRPVAADMPPANDDVSVTSRSPTASLVTRPTPDLGQPAAPSPAPRQAEAAPVPRGVAPAPVTTLTNMVAPAVMAAMPPSAPAAAPAPQPVSVAPQTIPPVRAPSTPAIRPPSLDAVPAAVPTAAPAAPARPIVTADAYPIDIQTPPARTWSKAMTPAALTMPGRPEQPTMPATRPALSQPAVPAPAPTPAPVLVATPPLATANPARDIPGGPAPAPSPLIVPASPTPAAADALPPRWSAQDTPPALTIVAQQPASPAPQPQPGTVASAAQVFGAAIQAAARDRDAPRGPDDATLLAPLAAPATITAPAQTADAQAPLDMRQERWPSAMIERIDLLRDAANATDTRIRLVPDALGAIDVAVRRDGDTVHVQFTAEQAATRSLLQEAQPRLAELADARGIRLSQGSVDTGAGQQQQQQQRAATPQQPQQPQAPARPRAATTTAADTDSTDTRLA